MSTNLSDDTITDDRGNLIVVGTTVEYHPDTYEPGQPAHPAGTVTAISDFDADVDDDTGRTFGIPPCVTVTWPNGETEDFTTSDWEHETAYDADGMPFTGAGKGVCEELLAAVVEDGE